MRSKRRERGVVSLEVLISIAAFTALMVLTTDILRLSHETANAQFVVNRAARRSSLGGNAGTHTDFVRQTLQATAAQHHIDTTRIEILICSSDALKGGCTWGPINGLGFDAGSARDLFTLGVRYNFQFAFGWLTTGIEAQAISRNEPFGS